MNTVGRACALGIVFGSAACSSDLGPSGNPAGEEVATASFAATSDWTVVPTENSGTGDNVLASVSGSAENDVWAVGQIIPDDSANVTRTLAHHYDGKKWTPVHTPNVGSHANALLGVATHGDKAWAVGYYFDETFAGRSLVEAWDGDAWAIADHPQVGHEDHLTGVSAAGANDVWAVGWVRDSAGTFSTLVERFDGGAWHVVPAPNPGALGNILYGVLARSADDVWAVGQKVGTHGPDEGLILHWDGQRFTESPSPSNGANSAELLGVSAAPGGPVRAIGDGEDFTSGTKVVAEADSGGGWIREAIPARPTIASRASSPWLAASRTRWARPSMSAPETTSRSSSATTAKNGLASRARTQTPTARICSPAWPR